MDAPVWSNDLLYLKEMIVIMLITIAVTWWAFYVSKRSDRRRALRLAAQKAQPPASNVDEYPDSQSAE